MILAVIIPDINVLKHLACLILTLKSVSVSFSFEHSKEDFCHSVVVVISYGIYAKALAEAYGMFFCCVSIALFSVSLNALEL